jgi:hypothetical protein
LEILLVDKNVERQNRICRELSNVGHDIYVASDRTAAVQLLRNGREPQIVLFDGDSGGVSMEMFLEALIQYVPKAKIYAMPWDGSFRTESPNAPMPTPEEVASSLATAIEDGKFLMNSLRRSNGELSDMVRASKVSRALRMKSKQTKR